MVQAVKRWHTQTSKKGEFNRGTIFKGVGRIKGTQRGTEPQG